jgi:hypothetical protein
MRENLQKEIIASVRYQRLPSLNAVVVLNDVLQLPYHV